MFLADQNREQSKSDQNYKLFVCSLFSLQRVIKPSNCGLQSAFASLHLSNKHSVSCSNFIQCSCVCCSFANEYGMHGVPGLKMILCMIRSFRSHIFSYPHWGATPSDALRLPLTCHPPLPHLLLLPFHPLCRHAAEQTKMSKNPSNWANFELSIHNDTTVIRCGFEITSQKGQRFKHVRIKRAQPALVCCMSGIYNFQDISACTARCRPELLEYGQQAKAHFNDFWGAH